MNKIEEALLKQFNKFRVVFWYDEKKELLDEYKELNLSEIEKIEVENNEFEVKHIINKQKPNTKFLLYFAYPRPNNSENWLLDMELAHTIFRTDQEAMFLQELGLEYHLKELVTEHLEFFKAKERRAKLKQLLGKDDNHEDIRAKMLAVVFNTDYVNLMTYIHAHSTAFVNDNDKFERDLERFNLKKYYWGKIKYQFNYTSEEPSIYDFVLEIFASNFVLSPKKTLSKESSLILSLWRDNIQYRDSFAVMSDKISKDIDVENKLNSASIEEIIDDNLFRLTDQKIISELINLITLEDIPLDKVTQIIKTRENKFFQNETKYFYKSVLFASQLINLVRKYSDYKYTSFDVGVNDYAKNQYEVDYTYRKFIWSYRKAKQNSILVDLSNKVEKIYSNDWLYLKTNNWQKVIDNLDTWQTKSPTSQQQFFNIHVKPFISKKQRLFVVISDALRYECGVELNQKIQSENRYEAKIEYAISSLPSYTQLGMASLLPHKKLSFSNQSDNIVVDGMSSSGIQGRTKILQANSGVRATAIKASEFMAMKPATDGREFVKQYDLIYIYHNRIDKTGDDKTSEEKVFDAVEEELDYLMDMLKRISNMNGTNTIITADHGFLYQNKEIDESDFATSNHKGEIWKENRRFVIGKNLTSDSSTKSFKATDLNISTDADVLIPKSINRLRVKGAGSKFVHGGASLQELVIPVIKVSKTKQDTTSAVDIDIIKTTDRITTNILAVSFIQSDLVTEKVLSRQIRAAIYADDGEILSDIFKFNFDIEEGSERQREVKHRFQLMAKASAKYKNQRVKLILEEPVGGTNKWKEYKDYHYTLNISFTNDFDEF